MGFQREIAVAATYVATTFCVVAITMLPVTTADVTAATVIPVDALCVPPHKDVFEPQIPEFALALAGQRVRIRGVMQPTLTPSGFKEYLLSPETKHRPVMSHVSNLPLHGLIPVIAAPGHIEVYTERPITVEGVFRIQVLSDEHGVYSVYLINHARVVEAGVRAHYPAVVSWFGC